MKTLALLEIFADNNVFKSEDSRGLSDYWLVKIDTSGLFLWEKTIKDRNA